MSIEKTITTVLFDVAPMLYHLVRYGLTERVEHARDTVTRPWLAACQPAPGAQPDTVDAELIAAWSDAASARVELVGVELELIHARAQLKRWDRRWELSEQVVKRLQTELDAARADVERLTSELARERDPDAEYSLANQLQFAAGVADQLAQAAIEVEHLTDENEQLRADVVRLTTAHDAADDDAVASAEKLKQLRQDLGQCIRERDEAREQLGDAAVEVEQLLVENVQLRVAAPMDALRAAVVSGQAVRAVNGATVTLRLENGKTLTGKVHNGMVNGWLVDHAGRSLVPAPDGGGDR